MAGGDDRATLTPQPDGRATTSPLAPGRATGDRCYLLVLHRRRIPASAAAAAPHSKMLDGSGMADARNVGLASPVA